MELDIEDCHHASYHEFSSTETTLIQTELTLWFRNHRRKLPWRGDKGPFGNAELTERARKKRKLNPEKVAPESTKEISVEKVSGYGVWVSEIMLQQTRVETVVDYYLRWMEKYPTIEDLSKASVEDVNKLWAGLGYYRRARNLLEGAQQVMENFGGVLPETVEELKKIKGIGDYTSGAIASIAFNKTVPLVDGNVIRVLSRLRAIKQRPKASKENWKLARSLVQRCESIKEFNQGLMELGALICTPKAPKCTTCPLRTFCHAHKEVTKQKRPWNEQKSKSEKCSLCEDVKFSELSVMNYPLKKKKKQPREENVLVIVVLHKHRGESKFFLKKRPDKGLLAGQWEFLAKVTGKKIPTEKDVKKLLEQEGFQYDNDPKRFEIDKIVHVFSHIRQSMFCHCFVYDQKDPPVASTDEENKLKTVWVEDSKLLAYGITTGIKKVYKNVKKNLGTKSKQKTMKDFFKKQTKKKRKQTKRKRNLHTKPHKTPSKCDIAE